MENINSSEELSFASMRTSKKKAVKKIVHQGKLSVAIGMAMNYQISGNGKVIINIDGVNAILTVTFSSYNPETNLHVLNSFEAPIGVDDFSVDIAKMMSFHMGKFIRDNTWKY